jgi:two-component system CheB/CheR fusion protein
MTILDGVLHLFDPSTQAKTTLPIDTFLRSLARDQKQHAIGVILSGMGADGTHGIQEIWENGGLTLAQDPASAKYDSMPSSAIEAGLVDVVQPADKLPESLLSLIQHPFPRENAPPLVGLEKVLILLRDRTGHDFSAYKSNTIQRRIQRRMSIHQCEALPEYIKVVVENPEELDLLFKEMLIGVTGFFRDPVCWEMLKTH